MLARRDLGERRTIIPLTQPDPVWRLPNPGGLSLESEAGELHPMALIRSAPLGERAPLGRPVELTDAVGALEGEYQDVEQLGAGGTEGVERRRSEMGVGISRAAPGKSTSVSSFVVKTAGYPLRRRSQHSALERRPDHGTNRHYRGHHDEAAGGSRI
jgi:hypothetical protein